MCGTMAVMRASRLLSLLLLLQTRGRMTAAELAGELEVSIRTIYRDVEALSSSGVPVYADRGPAGGYQLLDGYRTRLNGLTTEEASSLFLAGLPGPAAELGLGEVAANAELKMLAALPPEPRFHAARMRERFHLDVPGWYRDADAVPFLGEVSEAVWDQRPLRMTYRRWGPRDVERLAHPYGLVLKGGVRGTWWPPRTGERRAPTRWRGSSPPSFWTGASSALTTSTWSTYWQRYAADFRLRMHTGEALVRMAPGAEGDVAPHPRARRPSTPRWPRPDLRTSTGWVVLRLPTESVRHACWQLLRLGGDVEVLGPPELRERMIAAVARLSELYGTRQE